MIVKEEPNLFIWIINESLKFIFLVFIPICLLVGIYQCYLNNISSIKNSSASDQILSPHIKSANELTPDFAITTEEPHGQSVTSEPETVTKVANLNDATFFAKHLPSVQLSRTPFSKSNDASLIYNHWTPREMVHNQIDTVDSNESYQKAESNAKKPARQRRSYRSRRIQRREGRISRQRRSKLAANHVEQEEKEPGGSNEYKEPGSPDEPIGEETEDTTEAPGDSTEPNDENETEPGDPDVDVTEIPGDTEEATEEEPSVTEIPGDENSENEKKNPSEFPIFIPEDENSEEPKSKSLKKTEPDIDIGILLKIGAWKHDIGDNVVDTTNYHFYENKINPRGNFLVPIEEFARKR